MRRRTLVKIAALGTAIGAAPVLAQSHPEGARAMIATTSARVTANGVELYYEIHGEGAPLIMLHGGVNPSDFFGETLATMAESHQVYAVHLRGHGFSKDRNEPWSYEVMADDVAALMGEIGLPSADVMGWSLGGGVGLQLAIRHPERVKKLVVISMAYRAAGDYPEIRAAFDAMPAEAAEFAALTERAPFAALYPEIDWEVMFRKTGEMNQPRHDWTTGVAAITSPVLLMFTDADTIQLEHMTAFYQLLGGGQRAAGQDGSGRSIHRLAIIPGRTHYDSVRSPAVTMFANEFLLAE